MRRPAIITFPVMTAIVFGGAIAGLLFATMLAPELPFAAWLGLCSLPLAFIIGAHLWLGFAMLRMLAHCLRASGQASKHRPKPTVTQSSAIPPGSVAFVFTSLGISTLTGFILAIAPNRMGFLPTLLAFLLLGAIYGSACYLLARNGYLPVYDLEGEP
jgi:hypothetical protein